MQASLTKLGLEMSFLFLLQYNHGSTSNLSSHILYFLGVGPGDYFISWLVLWRSHSLSEKFQFTLHIVTTRRKPTLYLALLMEETNKTSGIHSIWCTTNFHFTTVSFEINAMRWNNFFFVFFCICHSLNRIKICKYFAIKIKKCIGIFLLAD